MKKKILSIALASAMILASTAVFAETGENAIPTSIDAETVINNQGKIVLAPYIESTYKVSAVSSFEGFKALLECTNGTDELTHLTISENTLLVDNQGNKIDLNTIKEGSSVTMFYNITNPTLMVLPVRYTPDVLVLNTENDGFVKADSFSDELVNSQNTLELNIDDSTVIEFANGAKMAASADDIKNSDAVVFYTTTTRSIPAQTTPSKVIILGDATDTSMFDIADEADIDVTEVPTTIGTPDGVILDEAMGVDAENYATLTVNGNKVDAHFIDSEGVTMLPIRVVAEAMGLDVNWDESRQAVSVGTTQMGVFLQIGENKYSKAKMKAAELEKAPELVDIGETSLTYVPVSFFADILEADVTTDETTGSIAIVYSAE